MVSEACDLTVQRRLAGGEATGRWVVWTRAAVGVVADEASCPSTVGGQGNERAVLVEGNGRVRRFLHFGCPSATADDAIL
jgi:hypothetical protein